MTARKVSYNDLSKAEKEIARSAAEFAESIDWVRVNVRWLLDRYNFYEFHAYCVASLTLLPGSPILFSDMQIQELGWDMIKTR